MARSKGLVKMVDDIERLIIDKAPVSRFRRLLIIFREQAEAAQLSINAASTKRNNTKLQANIKNLTAQNESLKKENNALKAERDNLKTLLEEKEQKLHEKTARLARIDAAKFSRVGPATSDIYQPKYGTSGTA